MKTRDSIVHRGQPRLNMLAALSLTVSLVSLFQGCAEEGEGGRRGLNQPLERLREPAQALRFELRDAEDNDALLAEGLSLRPIAQAPSPIVEGAQVQASDLLFRGTQLLVAYNFQGAEHKGALQVIDISDPEAPTLSAELTLPRVDLNRIQLYQDRYLIVAAGAAERAATLEIFDLGAAEGGPSGGEGQLIFGAGDAPEEAQSAVPQLVASLDLPSRQATMVALHEESALVTTGDQGGVLLIDLSEATAPRIIAERRLEDARHVEVLEGGELLLVTGGEAASLLRRPWSWLTEEEEEAEEVGGGFRFEQAPAATQEISLEGLSVGAPSWGFRVQERFHLSADERGLMTFSLADGGLTESSLVPTEGDANAGAISADQRLAFLANGQEGLAILDVQAGHPTQLLARFDLPGDRGSANAVALQGELVALADGLGGVKLLSATLIEVGGGIISR